MDPLSLLAQKYGTDKEPRAHNYTPIYHGLFADRRDRVSAVLEVGVFGGASIKMWHDYFPAAQIWGVDVNPNVWQHFTPWRTSSNGMSLFPDNWPRIQLIIADCKTFEVPPGPFDLVVDDGSHRTQDVMETFVRVWPHVKRGGYYVIEDTRPADVKEAPDHGLWIMWK
jgi:spermidine synthase